MLQRSQGQGVLRKSVLGIAASSEATEGRVKAKVCLQRIKEELDEEKVKNSSVAISFKNAGN